MSELFTRSSQNNGWFVDHKIQSEVTLLHGCCLVMKDLLSLEQSFRTLKQFL